MGRCYGCNELSVPPWLGHGHWSLSKECTIAARSSSTSNQGRYSPGCLPEYHGQIFSHRGCFSFGGSSNLFSRAPRNGRNNHLGRGSHSIAFRGTEPQASLPTKDWQ